MEKQIPQVVAGTLLGLTTRQVRRLIQLVRGKAMRGSCIEVEAGPRTDDTGQR